MMSKKILILIVFLVVSNRKLLHAQEDESSKRIAGNTIEKVEFKKYEKIDLGNISIDGEYVNPDDIMIKESERKTIKEKLYERDNLNEFTDIEILGLK